MLKQITTLSLMAFLFLGCTSKMDLIVKSEPKEADIYLVKDDLQATEVYMGKTNFKEGYPLDFEAENDTHTLIARKHGYEEKKVYINYSKEDNPEHLFVLEKKKKRKMAYAVPTVENEKIIFSLVYDWGYYDTIENSPNAVNVERVVVADNLSELIGRFDMANNKLVFSRSIPKVAINDNEYVEKLDLVVELVKEFDSEITVLSAKNIIKKIEQKQDFYKKSLDMHFYTVLNYFTQVSEKDKTNQTKKEVSDELNLYLESIKKIQLENISSELWMVNTSGGFGKSKLTNADKRWLDITPSITSDGGSVYFSSNRNGNTFNIWRLSTEGGMGITKITTSPYSEDFGPSVDASNEILSYASVPKGSRFTQVWTTKTNGSLPSQLRQGHDINMCSNGNLLVFNRKSSEGKNKIWTMKSNGASETMMAANASVNEKFASFSPDCQWVTYESDESGNKDIYIMKIDGSSKIQLTTNQSVDTFPVWGDDGYIYFASNRGLIWGIWRLKAIIEE